jgi:hypothetical protein
MDKAISRLVKEWEKRQHFLKRLNEEGCTDEEECADTACETDEDQFDDGVYTFFDSWIICKPRRCEIGDWVRGADIMPDSGIARNYDTGEKLPEDVSPRTDSVHHGASSSGHKKQSEQILVPCSGNA